MVNHTQNGHDRQRGILSQLLENPSNSPITETIGISFNNHNE
jgi:hypothetical protein